jgi:hypothetical protein
MSRALIRKFTYHAKNCAYLKCLVEESEGSATLVQIFQAAASIRLIEHFVKEVMV